MAIDFKTEVVNALYDSKVATDPAYQAPGKYNVPPQYHSGGVGSLTVDSAGSGYTSIPTVEFTGGNGSGASATLIMTATTAFVADAGTGYVVGDTITIAGGTSTEAVVLTVDTIGASGDVTGVSITTAGDYSELPASPAAQGSTSGAGTGATFTLDWGIAAAHIVNGGNYETAPTATVTGGGGSGAALSVSFSVSPAESNTLTMIELFRGYIATLESAQEARMMHEVITRMLAAVPNGGGATTFDGEVIAERAQAAGMRLYAGQIRNPNL